MLWATGHWGVTGFRPEKVKAKSSFACQLQSTHKDLSRVDLDLPEGLLVGLGYAATSPDSPLDFRQAQNAAERSGVASPHRWSLMLPTSARVPQEVYEPLIEIQYPMLCSRMGDTWQIGTTSIREDHRIASGLRFVHWCHASPNVHARHNPKNDPTVRVYQHLEDQLTKAGADTDDILALTTTREGATNLYAITSPLPTKRLMQRLQSKLQVPRPNTASLSTGCQPSSVAKRTTWIMTRSASHEQMWHTAEPPTSPS